LPKCRIDLDSSPTFRKLLRKLRRSYPQITDDLREIFEKIEEDYRRAAGAAAIPGFGEEVWKYRCKSSDLKRGAQRGFRIVAYYDSERNVLHPILVYTKPQQEDVSPEEIEGAISGLRQALEQEE